MRKSHIVKTRIIGDVGRFMLAIIFLLSGFSEIFYLHGFAVEVAQYSELYISSFFVRWSLSIAIIVCCVEISLGIFLFFRKYSLFSTLSILVLMTFFLYLTGINYLYPTMLGSIETCGCFGELIHFSAKGAFIKTIVLWVISFITVLSNIKRNRLNCKMLNTVASSTD